MRKISTGIHKRSFVVCVVMVLALVFSLCHIPTAQVRAEGGQEYEYTLFVGC